MVLDMLDRAPAMRAHVTETGPLPQGDLDALMTGAHALLMPSFAEGFGLPVGEALAAGVPVIASDILAHREVGEDAAVYLDPLDGPAWADAIMALTQNRHPELDPGSPDLVGRIGGPGSGPGRRAFKSQNEVADPTGWNRPNWDAHFATVLRVVEGVLS